MSFAANEGNQYDCRRPQVPNTTHLTPADARRNDACMDAPGWMAATNGQPMPRTRAEKEQRKALWMKAVWRSHAVLGGGSLRALAANRIEAATPPHARRSVGRILIEGRQVASHVAQRLRPKRSSVGTKSAPVSVGSRRYDRSSAQMPTSLGTRVPKHIGVTRDFISNGVPSLRLYSCNPRT